MPDPGGTIYAIGAEGTALVKIGSTRASVRSRLQALQTGYPLALSVLATAQVDGEVRQIEAHVHRFLADKRQRGEWFAIDALDDQGLAQLIVAALRYVEEQQPARTSIAAFHGRERLPIFQERLFMARQLRGMTQEDLAERTQLFKTDISKYERGESHPNLPRLCRLADSLNVSTDYLLGRSEDMTHA